jgi:hypothetical protein
MGRYVAAQRPTTCPNASVPADRQSTGCGVERDILCPLILGEPARRRQRPSPRLSARCSERVAFAPPLPRKFAPSRTVGVEWRKASKLRTEIKAGVSVLTRRFKTPLRRSTRSATAPSDTQLFGDRPVVYVVSVSGGAGPVTSMVYGAGSDSIAADSGAYPAARARGHVARIGARRVAHSVFR